MHFCSHCSRENLSFWGALLRQESQTCGFTSLGPSFLRHLPAHGSLRGAVPTQLLGGPWGGLVTDEGAFPGRMGWARAGGSPRSHPLLSVHLRVPGGAPHRERGTAVLAGALDGHRGLGVGRPAGSPSQTCRLPLGASVGKWGRGVLSLPRPQVSAANMYVLVSFILIFGCFLSLLFFSQTPLLLWPQRGKPRAADKRL